MPALLPASMGAARPRRGLRPGRSWGPWTATAALLVACTTLLAAPGALRPSSPTVQVPAFSVVDERAALGENFQPGIVLGGASNSSESFLAGIGVYRAASDVSLPALAAVRRSATGLNVSNATAFAGGAFALGGVYAAGWNGSAWLVGGQSGATASNDGALVTSHDGRSWANLSAEVAPYFSGGGIWAVGWNGSAWLVGGNSSSGPVLVAFDGARFVDRTSVLAPHLRTAWVQLLAWNGVEWLIGGQGLFELLRGTQATDLYAGSPFAGRGEFTTLWTGSAWLVGGYADRLAVVALNGASSTVGLPSAWSDPLVTFVLPVGDGYLVGGRADGTSGGYQPQLQYWAGPAGGDGWAPLTGEIPPSFGSGEFQAGFPAGELCAGCALLVGEGQYNRTTGYGLGALALLAPAR